MLDRLDAAVGDGIERADDPPPLPPPAPPRPARRARARRAEGLWARTATPPPRDGNALEVLIDGANALPAMAEAIRGARRHVHVCSLAPRSRTSAPSAAAARRRCASCWPRSPSACRCACSLWAGAPVPVFQPRRGAVARPSATSSCAARRSSAELDADGGRCTATTRSSSIVDDEVAFVGGIDLTALAGDRYDSTDHPPRRRDRLARRVVAAARAARARRRRPLRAALGGGRRRGARAARGARAGGRRSTRSSCARCPRAPTASLPRGEFSILEAYVRALRSARSS